MQRVFVQNNLTNSENNYSNSNEIIKNSINSRYMTKPNEINPISVLNYNFSGNGKYNEQLSNSQINNVNNSQILQISNNNNNFQQISIEVTIDKIRKKLTQRGVSGIFSIGKSFRINDTDNSKSISFSEFSNLCNKYSFKLNDVEIKSAFAYFDRKKSGSIDYEEFLRVIRGNMNQFRRNLVDQAFNILDKNKNGLIEYNDIVGLYDPSKHPQVIKGEKTPETVLNEFLSTFETHLTNTTNKVNVTITKQEWVEYYENVSMSVDDDAYFELMMNNCWRMNINTTYNNNLKGWSNKNEDKTNVRNMQENFQRRNISVQNNANNNNNYQNMPAPQNSNINFNNSLEILNRNEIPKKTLEKGQIILEKFKAKLFSRGSNSLFSLARQFKIIDDNNSKSLGYDEFTKVIKDFKIDLTQSETLVLFNIFDRNRNNSVDYDEFLILIKGEMNDSRKSLVREAFNILDADKSSVIEIQDLKNRYNMKKNPDVMNGKKSEEEAYGEFLQTLEYHFNIYKGKIDRKITLEEFYEYYNNVSCSIDSDEYFEVMIRNAWNLDNKPKYNQGWSSDYSNPKNNLKPNNNLNVQQPQNYNSNQQVNLPQPQTYVPEPQTYVPQQSYNPVLQSYNPQIQNFNSQPQNINKNQQIKNQNNNYNPNYANPQSDLVIVKLREKISSRGIHGIMGIRRSFKIADSNNSNIIDKEELTRLFKIYRYEFSEPEFKRLFDIFDTDRSGKIDFDEFIYGIVGEMNDFRKNFVKRAFIKLDKNGSGKIDIDDIRLSFNAKFHPDVKSGKKTEDEILGSFLNNFETHFSLIVIILFFKN